MPRNNTYGICFLNILIPLFILESVFHVIQFSSIDIYSLFRSYLTVFILSIVISILLSRIKRRYAKIIAFIVVTLLSAYSFVELIFKNYMVDFYSFNTVSDGATRIAQYVDVFVSSANFSYYLCFVPILISLFLYITDLISFHDNIFVNVVSLVVTVVMLIFTFFHGEEHQMFLDTYLNYSNKTMIVERMGISHFLFRDLATFVYDRQEEIIIADEFVEEEIVEDEYSRNIDDTVWNNLESNETNEKMKTIDRYLKSKPITQMNEMTGKYEGYNFIYFMVEALDYLAIDPELTPTLYDMYTNGNTFYNHYSPLYSCATGESEFVSYVSLFPYMNSCTPNYVYDYKFYEALPYLFKEKGYETFSLHNWRDEFYERNRLHPNLGFDSYTDIDDIWKDTSIPHTDGWQSDSMLIEQAIKQIEMSEGNFFCDIITSVMHFPYDASSYWGDHYLGEVRKVHPDWPIDYQRYMSKSMDFDKGLEILLEYLEENDLAQNTIICIYADHRPYWLNYDIVADYTSWINDRSSDYGIYRSPFIIYEPGAHGTVNYNYCSTLDHVPTIANLFDLPYDPRLYMGNDIYSGNQTVIFADGNWLNHQGIYYAVNDSFVPFDDDKPDERDINYIRTNVKNIINISSMIFDENYFEKRKNICCTEK